MPDKKNPRLPDCTREPSKRLQEKENKEERKRKEKAEKEAEKAFREAVYGSARHKSTERTENISKNTCVQPREQQVAYIPDPLYTLEQPSSDEEENHPIPDRDQNEETQEQAIHQETTQQPFTMAALQPKNKFKEPPIFKGGPDDDVIEWINKYETAGTANHWGDAHLLANFEVYLDAAALNWFKCINNPGTWRDQAATAAGPAVTGLRSLCLTEFRQANYALFKESKLRNRVQGINEDASDYYYNILNMCREVNPAMDDQTKLDYLYRGLKPSLLEKILPFQPADCAALLAQIKIQSQAAKIAHQRTWSSAILDTEKKPTAAINMAKQDNTKETNTLEVLLQTMTSAMKQLQTSVDTIRNTSDNENAQNTRRNGNGNGGNDQQNRGGPYIQNQGGYAQRSQGPGNYRGEGYQRYGGYIQDQRNYQHNPGAWHRNRYNPQNNDNHTQYHEDFVERGPKNRPVTWNPEVHASDNSRRRLNQHNWQNQGTPQFNHESRSQDGRPICKYCNKVGHIARYCMSNPSSENYRGSGGPPQRNSQTATKATTIRRIVQDAPIEDDPTHYREMDESRSEVERYEETEDSITATTPLRINLLKTGQMLTEKVLCGTQEVDGYIDTGADISVIDPSLLEMTPFIMEPWTGPKIVMANGTKAEPLGGARISITHKNGTASGLVLVMKMRGVRLLLGNDLLKQYGNMLVNYNCKENPITLGANPLAAIQPITEEIKTHTLRTNEAKVIPAFSVEYVKTKMPSHLTGNWMIRPNTELLQKFFISVGYAIVSAKQTGVPVANLSSQSITVPPGVKLGELDKCTCDNIPEDTRVMSVQIDELKETRDETQRQLLDKIEGQISKKLTTEQQEELKKLLKKRIHCFAENETDLGRCNTAEHEINTGNSPPIYQAPYKSAWKERELIQQHVDKMLKQGIIEPSDSPWSSPVVLAKKSDGSWRFCADYRKLNAVTTRDTYPLPRIAAALSRLEGAQYFSIFDLQAGFHQINLKKKDQPKTAFITADGLYQFNVMPFGLMNAPGTFQRTMDRVLSKFKWTTCLIYLDDVVVYSTTFRQHLERLDVVLECLEKAELKLKWKKCHFAEQSLKILGHIVDKWGISPDPEKLAAVEKFPHPTEGKNVADKVRRTQSFLGLGSYYRKHIKNFAKIARPLTNLTKQDGEFNWGPEEEQSFRDVKQALLTSPVLAHPNYELPMEIIPDACGYGIGGVLAQRIDNKEHPVAYASRLLCQSEINYSITEKECLALIWCLKKFREYVWGTKIRIITDHEALCWLMTKKDLAGRLARWSLALQEYDVTIVYRSGKLHNNADCLSRNPLPTNNQNEQDSTLALQIVKEAQEEDNEQHQNQPTSFETAQREYPTFGVRIRKIEKSGKKDGSYILEEGRLFQQTLKNGKLYYRLCVPPAYRQDILKACHDDITAGHMGIHRTIQRITTRFYWPNMTRDIHRYVQTCPSCQGRKGVQNKPAGMMQCIKVEKPFEKIGIDLLGPFPLSNKGNRMICVAIDYLTKWVEVKAMPTGKAADVAEFLVERIFLRHGAPASIISDRGKCFLSELFQAVVQKLQTNHKTTSSYHAQANGAVERMNHTLASMLSMYVSGDHKDWDEPLQYVAFAYNTAKQESTGYSPFHMLYGREPKLPIDIWLGADANPRIPAQIAEMDYATRVMAELTSTRQIVKEKMTLVQAKQKERYDDKHRNQDFKPGELVLIYRPFRKVGKAEKLLHRWLGPKKIIRQTTPVNYEVQNLSGKGTTEIVHVVSMKPFYDSVDRSGTDRLKEGESETITETEPTHNAEEVPTVNTEVENSRINTENNETETDPPSQSEPTTTGVRRSCRTRRLPQKLLALLFSFTFCLTMTTNAIPDITVRENSLFHRRPGIAFSESSWTIITDLDLGPADKACKYLREKFTDQTKMALTTSDSEWSSDLQLLASERVRTKIKMFEQNLDYSMKRLDTFKNTITGSIRHRRGIINAGGTALQWLFGVATQTDLESINNQVTGLTNRQQEVAHILQQQATVVNESLWEVRTTTKMVEELRKQYAALQRITEEAKAQIAGQTLKTVEFEYFTHLSATFDAIETVLQWLHQLVNDLDVGLGMLANGHLSPQIFPPTQLESVLNQIKSKLPNGWSLTSTDLWLVYQEAQVSVAVQSNNLRLFIRIPILDDGQQYTLFKIFNLPSVTKKATHGVHFANLPDYLAVTQDLEAFIELSETDLIGCSKTDRPLCSFHTGISKKTSRRSCAMALFMGDKGRQENLCRRQFTEWKGSEAIYLGKNKWVVTSPQPHEVVITCPLETGRSPFEAIPLPAIGIFDIPPGCTARSEDWIFPASTEGRFEFASGPREMPLIDAHFLLKPNVTKTRRIIEVPTKDQTALDEVSEILARNSQALASEKMTDPQIKRLLTETQEATRASRSPSYPYELWVGIFVLLGMLLTLGYLHYKLYLMHFKLHQRLRSGANDQEVPLNEFNASPGAGE